MAKPQKIDRRLCLNRAKDKLVEANSREAAYLYGLPGDFKDPDELKKLGYKPIKGGATAKAEDPPENKMAPAPENKGANMDALKKAAKKLGIKGFSKMKKGQLEKAIAEKQ